MATPRMCLTYPLHILAAFAAAVVLCGLPQALYAAQVIYTPSVDLRGTYDDNSFFSSAEDDDDEGDYEVRLTPALSVERSTERHQTSADLSYDIVRYMREDDRDRIDHNYGLSHSYAASPRWTLSFDGSYRRASSFETVLEEEGFIVREGLLQIFSVAPSAVYSLSERQSLSMYVSLQGNRYENNDNFDSLSYGPGLTYRYILSERTSLDTSLSFLFSQYERDSQTPRIRRGSTSLLDKEERENESVSLSQAINHSFSDRLSVQLGIGGTIRKSTSDEFTGRFVDSETGFFQVPGTTGFVQDLDDVQGSITSGNFTNSNVGTVAAEVEETEDTTLSLSYNAAASYALERGGVNASASRQSYSSAIGETTDNTRVLLNFNYRLLRQLTARVGGGYTQSTRDDNDSDRSSYSINSSLTYRMPKRNLRFSCGYSYTRVEESNSNSNDNPDRNRIFVGIGWYLPVEDPT